MYESVQNYIWDSWNEYTSINSRFKWNTNEAHSYTIQNTHVLIRWIRLPVSGTKTNSHTHTYTVVLKQIIKYNHAICVVSVLQYNGYHATFWSLDKNVNSVTRIKALCNRMSIPLESKTAELIVHAHHSCKIYLSILNSMFTLRSHPNPCKLLTVVLLSSLAVEPIEFHSKYSLWHFWNIEKKNLFQFSHDLLIAPNFVFIDFFFFFQHKMNYQGISMMWI